MSKMYLSSYCEWGWLLKQQQHFSLIAADTTTTSQDLEKKTFRIKGKGITLLAAFLSV